MADEGHHFNQREKQRWEAESRAARRAIWSLHCSLIRLCCMISWTHHRGAMRRRRHSRRHKAVIPTAARCQHGQRKPRCFPIKYRPSWAHLRGGGRSERGGDGERRSGRRETGWMMSLLRKLPKPAQQAASFRSDWEICQTARPEKVLRVSRFSSVPCSPDPSVCVLPSSSH